MAASDYDFINTRNDIIASAFRKIGVLAEGQVLSGDQTSEGAQELNTIIASWEADGIKLFQLEDESFTTAASDFQYTPTNSIVGIMHATYNASGLEIPLPVYTLMHYRELTDREESTGSPLAIAYDFIAEEILIYPTPDDAYPMSLIVAEKIKDYDSAASTGSVDRQWQRALIWSVALELAPGYGIPLGMIQFIEKQANTWIKKAKVNGGRSEFVGVRQVKGLY